MICSRCSGLMAYEKFYFLSEIKVEIFWGFRCIACGEIIDEKIIENRIQHGIDPFGIKKEKRKYHFQRKK